MNRPSVSPKPLTGAKVLFMLLTFFGVVIGVNMIMMRLAIQTLPGTDVDSAYSASLAYEGEIAAAKAAKAAGWLRLLASEVNGQRFQWPALRAKTN